MVWIPVIAIVLAASWVVPIAAIPVVWPLLFFLPGFAIIGRVAPGLRLPGRIGLGIVLSVVLAAHAMNAIALVAGGFDRTVVFVGTGLLAIVSVVARPPWPGTVPPSGEDRGAWFAALGAFATVGGVLALSAWHRVADNWVSGGWNWSDFLVHVSIGSSLAAGNFPPQVPYAAGAPLSYHWFADFHGAIAASAAGIDVIPVFVLSSAVMAGAFALLVWELARAVVGDRRALLPATLLAIFGGGLGWIRLPLDVTRSTADLVALVSSVPYDNTWADDWPLFRIASVLGTGFLTHRATAFGLPILVAVALLAWTSLDRRPLGMLVAGLLAALLAPFHFYFLPAAYFLVLAVALARRAWRRPTWLRDAGLFLAPVVLALPFIVGPVLLQGARGSFRPVAGWGEAPFELGVAAVAFFYLTNLGLPAVLGAIALLRPGPLPGRAFLGLWAIGLFLVPNLVVVGAVEFDMNKFFQAMWVAVALLAGWLIRTWRGPAVVAVILVSALSPALVAAWHVGSTPVALSGPHERAARWIESSTPPGSVFVTEAWVNSPVDLAGRLRVTSFGPYVANLGLDAEARAIDVRRVFCGGDTEAAEVMARYGASYVLSPGGLLDCGEQLATDFSSSPLFDTVYRLEGVTIWRRRG